MNGVYCEICGKEHIHDSDGFKTKANTQHSTLNSSELDYFVVKDDSGELIEKVVCAATGVILEQTSLGMAQ